MAFNYKSKAMEMESDTSKRSRWKYHSIVTLLLSTVTCFCFTLNGAPSEAPWIANAHRKIELKENNANELGAKLEYLRKQYTRKIKEKKKLFFMTVENEDDYSRDEIKAMEKKIERMDKEIKELEVKLINIENQARNSKKIVKKLKRVIKNAESGYRRIKSASENDLEDLKLKTMKEFITVEDGKVKEVKKKKRFSFFSKFRLPRKEKSELHTIMKHKSKKSSETVKKKKETKKAVQHKQLTKEKEKIKKEAKKPKKMPRKKKIKAASPEPVPDKILLNADSILIDDFNAAEPTNKLGNRTNAYQMTPSTSMIDFQTDTIEGAESGVLRLEFDKKNKGGPHWRGGWCGYYSMLRDGNTGAYLNASEFKYISFWVKGETGKENFAIGLADKRWDQLGDSVKSNQVNFYVKNSKLNTKWQKVKIPLEEFEIDKHQLASVSICFESFCFRNGAGSGSVYIDNLALEK